jgi:predicted Zn-dependent protease
MARTEGVRVMQSAPERVNGFNAVAVVAQANTQQGAVGLLNYFIEDASRVYSFMGVTSTQLLSQYNRDFERIMTRFDRLNDPSKLRAEPTRLAIVTVPRSAPFTSFLPTGVRTSLTAEELAIMNQVKLDETVPAGAKLKMPR